MKILLVCAAGMSTSLLVNSMKKVAGKEDEINALPVNALEKNAADYDVILVGPQIRYKFNEVKKLCEGAGKPCGLIDMAAYGQMNGNAVYTQAKGLYQQ